jgi:hypothetical protein
MNSHYLLFALALFLWSCETAPTIDDPADELLQKAAGDISQWQNVASIQFEKTSTLYDSSGAVESHTEQLHHYTYHPNRRIEIVTPATETLLIWDILGITKSVQDTLKAQEEADKAKPSMEAATFVMELPYRLVNDEVELAVLDNEVLENWGEMEVLEARYNDNSGDIWRLYFELETHLLRAYRVQHADHISYVINEKVHEMEGLYFPHERKSYRINEQGEKLYLRAAYVYENMDIEWIKQGVEKQ